MALRVCRAEIGDSGDVRPDYQPVTVDTRHGTHGSMESSVLQSLVLSVHSATCLNRFTPSRHWEADQPPSERGIEGWIEAITVADRWSGIAAAAAAAQWALPLVTSASNANTGIDFGGPDDGLGGDVSPREQVSRVRQWLKTPTPQATRAVSEAAERTRQLNVWDEDLRPLADDPSTWYWYFVEAANLLTFAVVNNETGDPDGSDINWPASVCAARSGVCAHRSIHAAGVTREVDAEAIIAAVRAALSH